MPVIDQLEKATDTIFDFAETTNERAHEATKNLVTKAQDVEVPFADRLPKLELPLIDRLPEPVEAVDAYFGLVSSGIETNRSFAEKLIHRFGETTEETPAKAAPKKTAAKKTSAKKTTTKKTTTKKS